MRFFSSCFILSRLGLRSNLDILQEPCSLMMASSRSLNNVERLSETSSSVCQLNHAGASPSPQSVMDRVFDHMKLEQSIGGYGAAQKVAQELEEVYQRVAQLIHAHADEVALCESATVAWTRAFYAMAEKQLQTKNEVNVILISEAEYSANVVAASQFAKNKGWTVLAIPSDVSSSSGKSTGIVDLQALDSILSGSFMCNGHNGNSMLLDPTRIAMICITHVPTNSGIVNPVQEIGQRVAKYNQHKKPRIESNPQILYLVDACQSVGHIHVDVQEILCHAMVATGRKYLRGPRGSGFLFLSSVIVSDLWPNHIDHYGVPILEVPAAYQDGQAVESLLTYEPRYGASRFEFWESNIANRLGLKMAIEECIRVGIHKIEIDCMDLSKSLRKQLAEISSIVVHHESSTSCGIVSFYSTELDSAKIKMTMQQHGFELSCVPATSTPIDSAKTKVPDLVRASVSYTNTPEDIEAFVRSLKSLLGD